jgi:hypothetical protein
MSQSSKSTARLYDLPDSSSLPDPTGLHWLTRCCFQAPCAKSALYYNVQSQTADKCPTDAAELQGCICTKNNNIADVKAGLTSSVSYSCGSTASDDHASVATVLSAYCNQESKFAFPTPVFPVEAYITEVAEIAVLAPCAASALGWGLK